MTPYFRWKLEARLPDGTPFAEYGPEGVDGDGGITGFPAFDVDASGNCLTMTFEAIPSKCQIFPRDFVFLYRYDDDVDDWVEWWSGVVTVSGTTRSPDVQQYQALGLKQVFYERVLRTNRWPSAPAQSVDAASIPDWIESGGVIEYGIPNVTFDPADAPEQGFQVGVAIPNRQTFGDFLDARARQVGRFVVPPGETYDYDGETYVEDAVVPETTWGVNAAGEFFFRRIRSQPVSVFENDPDTDVDWSPFSSEGKANYFTFLLLAGVDRERLIGVQASLSFEGDVENPPEPFTTTEQSFIPLTVSGPVTPSTDAVVEKLIEVQNPLDFLTRTNVTLQTNALWDNLANAVDGDPSTFADYGGSFTPITATGGTVTDVGDFRIHTFTSGGTFSVSDAGSNPEVEYLIVAGGGGGGGGERGAGGGGAGGMIRSSGAITATSYTVVVGAGGAGGTYNSGTGLSSRGSDGGSSSVFGVSATGGGGGGVPQASLERGRSGGSGGGSATSGSTVRVGGSGTAGEGNKGGDAVHTLGSVTAAAGGGGKGSAAPNVAGSGFTYVSGAGGLGEISSITGSAVTYATGGDGRAADTTGGGANGAANTGNGGQGYTGVGGVTGDGGAGGSGIVVIRYRLTNPIPNRVSGAAFDYGAPGVLVSDPVGAGPGAFAVWYSSDEPLAFAIKREAELVRFIDFNLTRTIVNAEIQYEYPATNTDTEIRPRLVLIPALSPSSISDVDLLENGPNTLFILGSQGTRIHDIGWFSPDTPVIRRVAESLVQNPTDEASVVDRFFYYPFASDIEINLLDTFAVELPVERTEWSLTVDGGVRTRYYAGNKFDPDLETERIVLDAAIRRLSATVEPL